MGGGGGGDSNELKLALERIKAQGKGNLSDYHRQLLEWSRNVDKRYAWVVLGALWLMMAATLGPYRIYGLIFAKQTAEGVYTREEASWPVSMIFTVENVIGPFVSVIAYHISYRQSMLIGSLLLTLANGLTAFSNALWIDILLIGFVQGIGYAFIFMPFMEIINSYFIKYRNTALGIALCGGTVSIFAWAPIFQWVLQRFPWRMSYLGIGAVCGIGLFMVPLLKPNPKPNLNAATKSNQAAPEHQSRLARLSVRALSFQNSMRRQSTITISRQTIGLGASGTSPDGRTPNMKRNASIVSVNPFASSVGLERKISRAMHSNSGSSLNRPQMPKNASMISELSQTFETISLSDVEPDSDFKMSVIWDILKSYGWHCIWISELLYFYVFSLYVLVLVDLGVDKGLSRENAQSLLNYQSVGELLGRLVLTMIVDLGFMSNKNITIFLLLIVGGLLSYVTFATSYLCLAIVTVALSAFSSLLYILLNGLLVDYLGERQVTIGYGMASCIGGILMFGRPYAVGYFRDNLGSYDPMMHCLGASCAVGAALWVMEPLFSRRKCQQEPSNESMA